MEFKCYSMMGTALDSKEPVSWCVVGGMGVFTGPTLEYTKQLAQLEFGEVQFTENCGWIFVGEEYKLVDPQYEQLLNFTEQIRNMPKEGT